MTGTGIRGLISVLLLTGLTAGAALAETAPICAFRQQIIGGKAATYGAYALFTGPSGTGKTMTAKVLAESLGLSLHRIDLSQVVSKYIGETEKNLDRIFDSATTEDTVLLLDEGDALFGKHTDLKDSKDRHANKETGYLLERLENYEGTVILTTNLRTRINRTFRQPVVIHFTPGQPSPRDQLKACK